MTQWKLFEGDVAEVSTFAFHEHRERAPHLEQPGHRDRLVHAAGLVLAAARLGGSSVSDLGCGDGGLLSLLPEDLPAWGYDFGPANAAGWTERAVTAEALDVFGKDAATVKFGDITCTTEVLEHLTDPHAAVAWIAGHSRFIVASSPWDERPWGHDPCHAWAFDQDGYRDLIADGGFRVLQHNMVGRFQVILGMRT